MANTTVRTGSEMPIAFTSRVTTVVTAVAVAANASVIKYRSKLPGTNAVAHSTILRGGNVVSLFADGIHIIMTTTATAADKVVVEDGWQPGILGVAGTAIFRRGNVLNMPACAL